MTRHVIDHPRNAKGTRVRRFARIERTRGIIARPPVETLRRKPKQLSGALRLKRFLAIERAEL
jgi:hypothetical protein